MIPALILGFLCGSFPAAYLAGKMKGVDIRCHGSGNVGATNAFRVLGRGPGMAVFAVDFLKGCLPAHFFPQAFGLPQETTLFIGVACILGHVFTPWLGFRGGKGIATGSGVLLAVNSTLFAVAILSWLTVFFLSKIVSLSSLIAVAALFLSALFSQDISAQERWFFGGVLAFVLWTHRANIGRLLKGEEKRVG